MVSLLGLTLAISQQVDREFVQSMKELLRLNPSACVHMDLKDTKGEQSVYLNEKGEILLMRPTKGSVIINPSNGTLAAIQTEQGKNKLCLVDPVGVRFQMELSVFMMFRWIGSDLFLYSSGQPTIKISKQDSGSWAKEEWANVKTNFLVPGKEPGSYFAVVDWPDHKEALTKIVSVDAAGNATNPEKYDSTSHNFLFTISKAPKVMFESGTSEFVVGQVNSGGIQKHPCNNINEFAWLPVAQAVVFVRNNPDGDSCNSHFSLYNPMNGEKKDVAGPDQSIKYFVGLSTNALLVLAGREKIKCLSLS